MNGNLFHGDLVASSRILYTPSSFAKEYLTHLQEAGTLDARSPHTSQRSHLNSYLFFAVLRGSGRLSYMGASHPLRAGDCAFIDCKNGYAHSTANDLWQLQWLHFYGPAMDGIYGKYVQRGGLPVFHPHDLHPFLEIMNDAFETARSSDYLRDMRLNEQLNRLLTHLMEYSWNPEQAQPSTTDAQTLTQIRAYINEHYAERITLDNLAEMFFISRFHLSRSFRQYFGIRLSDYIINVRITNAKRFLRFSDESIESIAVNCGIDDANYFSRMFKKVEGVSPREFRQRWRG